jgi:hypothetical protein
MREKLKHYALVICLFFFLFVVIGNGLHLTSAASFIGALSGTPLVVFAFNRWGDIHCGGGEARTGQPASEIIPLRKQL